MSLKRRAATPVAIMLTLAPAFSPADAAVTAEWQLVRPDNTGVPGAEIRFLRFGPDDNLWVSARWEFWEKGGIGIHDGVTDTWSVISTVDTPIPSGYINDVVFDPDGSLWIATSHNELTGVDGGLLHKQGDQWTIYDRTNSPLLHNGIRSIEQDSMGNLWINNTDVREGLAALFRFDGTSWTSYRVPDQLPWEAPWDELGSLHIDADDNVWVTNSTLPGVARFDGTEWTLHGDDISCFDYVTTDNDGNVWVISCHSSYSVWKYDGTSFVPFGGGAPPLSSTSITLVTCDRSTGDMYIGNWMGEVVKSTNGGASWSFFGQVSSFVTGIAFDPLGDDVYVGSHRGVHHLNGFGGWIESFNSPNTGFPDYFVDYMSLDRSGYFWVATGEAGLSRFDGQRWRNWGDHNLGSEPYPFAGNEPMGGAYEDRDGTVWMGGNGIARWDPVTEDFTGFWNWENNPGMGVTMFPFFAEDMNGELFAATDTGAIFRFNGDLWVREPVDPYSGGHLPGMKADSQGNVWIAAWFDLHKWDGEVWTVVGTEWPIFDLGGINVFDIGPDDVFWLGLEDGLARWDGTDLTVYDMTNSPIPSLGVKGVAVRSDGMIGMATSEFGSITPFPNGVAIVDGDIDDPASWTSWHYEDSPLPHYQLGRVAFDVNGSLWVSAISEAAAVLHLSPIVDVPTNAGVPLTGGWLVQNRPNPFRGATTIGFELPRAGAVSIDLIDVNGRLVRRLLDRRMAEGRHELELSGEGLVPGVYFYRLTANGHEETRRLSIVR